jgi:hypothetical protein
VLGGLCDINDNSHLVQSITLSIMKVFGIGVQ